MNNRWMHVASIIALACSQGSPAASPEGTGFYVFVEVGHSDVDRDVGSVDRIRGDNMSLHVGAGYEITPIWAVQLTYSDLGGIDASVGCPPDFFCIAQPGIALVPFSSAKADIDAFSLELRASYPVPRYPLAVFAKLGVAAWDSDWRSNSVLNESGNSLLYGAGVLWTPDNSAWGLTLSYEHINLDVQSLKAGAMLRF